MLRCRLFASYTIAIIHERQTHFAFSNYKLQQKSISLSCNDLQESDFSSGPSEIQTLYELLTAIFHGLVATNSPFSSATREAMRLVDKVAATSTFNTATAVQSSVQHQIATPPSQPSIQTCSTPLPDSNSVCTHVTDDAVHSAFSLLLEPSTSQLEAHISSIENLLSIFERLHVLKTSSSYRTVFAAVRTRSYHRRQRNR